MGISKLIQLATILAMLAVSTGQLPKILWKLRVVQLELIKESQASKWGTPWIPKNI